MLNFSLFKRIGENLFQKEKGSKACNGKQILDHKLIVERKAEQIKIYGSLKTNNNVNKLSWVISKLAAGPPRQ